LNTVFPEAGLTARDAAGGTASAAVPAAAGKSTQETSSGGNDKGQGGASRPAKELMSHFGNNSLSPLSPELHIPPSPDSARRDPRLAAWRTAAAEASLVSGSPNSRSNSPMPQPQGLSHTTTQHSTLTRTHRVGFNQPSSGAVRAGASPMRSSSKRASGKVGSQSAGDSALGNTPSEGNAINAQQQHQPPPPQPPSGTSPLSPLMSFFG
jgi:hypothetical protein